MIKKPKNALETEKLEDAADKAEKEVIRFKEEENKKWRKFKEDKEKEYRKRQEEL